jgi:predicted NBD/HSP70 family sugar kinase
MSILEKKKEAVKALLFKSEGISRKEISALLDIDVRTVSAYLDDLEKGGFLKSELVSPSGKGRPSLLYSPDFSRMAFVGIHICKGGVNFSVCGLSGEPLEGLSGRIDIGAESKLSIINKILFSTKKYIAETKKNWNVIGIGVACSRWLSPPVTEYDIFAEINDILERSLNLPVFRTNPISALLYKLMDKDKDASILLVHPGNVLEAGIVLDGELPLDSSAYEREFQHCSGNSRGPLCYCGRKGCLDNYITEAAVSDYHMELTGKRKSCPDIYQLAEKGDRDAVKTLKDCGKFLGIAAAAFAEKHGLELVSVLSSRPDVFFDNAAKSFKKNCKIKARFEKFPIGLSVVNAAAKMVAYKTVKKFL